MAKQVINFGTTINDGTGDNLRVGAQKINSNFTEIYELLGGSESISIVTKITAGPGLVASSPAGDITISTLPASQTEPGVVVVGTGINVDDAGVISVTPYALPKAATNILGGIKVGDNLTINNDGVLSAIASPYALPTASQSVKGGIKIGSGLEIVDGVVNVTTSEIAAALQSGSTTLSLLEIPETTHSLLQSNIGISLSSVGNSNFTGVLWSDDISAVNQVYVSSLGFTISAQDSELGLSSQWRFRPDGLLASPAMAFGTLDGQDQIISLVGGNNISVGNKDLKSYIRISGPTEAGTDSGGIPRANKISIISNNVDDFVNGQGFTSQGRIELIAGGTASSYRASITMGQLGDMSQAFPPTGTPVETLTNHTEMMGGVAFYGDVILQGGSILGIRNKMVFQDGTMQNTAYTGSTINSVVGDPVTLNARYNEVVVATNGRFQDNVEFDYYTATQPDVGITQVQIGWIVNGPGLVDIEVTDVAHSEGVSQIFISGFNNYGQRVDFQGEGEYTFTNTVANSWVFGIDGSLTVPGIITKAGGLQLVSTGTTYGSSVNVYGDLGRVIVRTSNETSNKDWQFNVNGTLTFPDDTVQTTAYQKVAVPTNSYGSVGDKAGMIAFDNTYSYYCTADYVDTLTNIWKRTAHDVATW